LGSGLKASYQRASNRAITMLPSDWESLCEDCNAANSCVPYLYLALKVALNCPWDGGPHESAPHNYPVQFKYTLPARSNSSSVFKFLIQG
jgi:hypothetical protein